MPDLDRDLRDLLTDEHLQLPVRPDALRIVHEGVRRRRRRRAITTSTALAATVGAVVAGLLTVPAALTASGADHTTPVQPKPQYDVAWVDKPAPQPWAPKPVPPTPPTMDAPGCLAGQLTVDGAQGNRFNGALLTTIRLRNTSGAPCLLIGRPEQVVARAPGRPDVVATRGLDIASGGVGGDLQPEKLGYLTLESDRDCPARQANRFDPYSSLTVTLPSGTSLTLPLPLDVRCGLATGGLGVEVPPAPPTPDPRNDLAPNIHAPATVAAGQTLVYLVTLTNPTDRTISLRHCPGYVESMQAGVQLARATLGLDCSRVGSIPAGGAVRYEMRLAIPADSPPGATLLSWQLQTGASPEASARVEISAA